MIRTLLAATDFSTRAELALARAARIAAATGARLVVAHAVDDDETPEVVEARAALADGQLARRVARGDLGAAEPRVVLGDPFAALADLAEETGADLIVAGDRRRTALRALFLDTTVERLARLSPAPLLVVRRPASARYAHALAGMDAEPAPAILRALDALGSERPARVTLLHAHEPLEAGLLARAGVSRAERVAHEAESAEAARSRLAAALGPDAARTELVVASGDPAAAILSAAAARGCDLVAVGTHARRGAARLLLGSVASRLMREGETDLLVLPARLLFGEG